MKVANSWPAFCNQCQAERIITQGGPIPKPTATPERGGGKLYGVITVQPMLQAHIKFTTTLIANGSSLIEFLLSPNPYTMFQQGAELGCNDLTESCTYTSLDTRNLQ